MLQILSGRRLDLVSLAAGKHDGDNEDEGSVWRLWRNREEQDMKANLHKYREARKSMRENIDERFPPGTRVKRIGTADGALRASVMLADNHPPQIAGDMVLLLWDDLATYFVPVDEIEVVPGDEP